MAQPTQQKVLLDLFPTKKTQHRSEKTKVVYHAGSTTAKMKVQARREGVACNFTDTSAAKRIKYLMATEKAVSNGFDEYKNDTPDNQLQSPHLGSNWASNDKRLVASCRIYEKIDESSVLVNMQYENDKFPIMEKQEHADAERKRTSSDTDATFQKYRPRLSEAKRKRQFLSYFNLVSNQESEEKEEKISETTNNPSAQYEPIAPEKFLSIDISSPMGQKIWCQQSDIMIRKKKIDIDAITCYCPKRVSARCTKNSDNFVITFKEPKVKRAFKQGVQGQANKYNGWNNGTN